MYGSLCRILESFFPVENWITSCNDYYGTDFSWKVNMQRKKSVCVFSPIFIWARKVICGTVMGFNNNSWNAYSSLLVFFSRKGTTSTTLLLEYLKCALKWNWITSYLKDTAHIYSTPIFSTCCAKATTIEYDYGISFSTNVLAK